MYERTFVLVKPDGVSRGLVEEIVKRMERAGLGVKSLRRLRLDRRLAEELYSGHRERNYFEETVKFMLTGEVVAMIVEGEGAIAKMRELAGATDPARVAKGTIRGDYGTRIFENIIHVADSAENVERELRLFFKD